MNIPKISVVIPCYNAQTWIRETLNSVLIQKYGNIEIIVVDDGSTDDTSLIVEREFPLVNVIKTDNNGPSRARNIGTSASSGDFIQYLDADDLLAEGKLKLQVEALLNNTADVAYGDWVKIIKTHNGDYVEVKSFKRKMQNPEIDLFTDFWCPPAVYLFRRWIVDRVGAWNEGLPIIQDARFVLDCALNGANFVYCPDVMARYRVHESNSVSTQDGTGFVKDCMRNAIEVEDWWQYRGGLKELQLQALVTVYGYIARSSFQNDPETFELAYQALERLRPNYVPEKPKHLRIVSLLLGYRKAEALALNYRKAKHALKKLGSILVV